MTTDFIDVALSLIIAAAFIGLPLAILWTLNQIDDWMAQQYADDVYDWRAEGDFDTPTYLRDDHNPLLAIDDAAVAVRCSCRRWSLRVPIHHGDQQKAYDAACDLYWTSHIGALGATA